MDESHAEVELQNLLNHTATRVLELQKDVVNNIEFTSVNNLMLIGKWGFDGSTGYAEYKQAVADKDTYPFDLLLQTILYLEESKTFVDPVLQANLISI